MKSIRSLVLALVLAPCAFAESPKPSLLPPNARVAIIGDSITEQKQYSKFMEVYLLACTGRDDIKCFQFGWGGETAGGFKNREENDLSAFHPNVATFCYGMNDGQYKRYEEAIGSSYEANMREVLKKAQAIGVTSIVAGTPGAVDTFYFQKNPKSAVWYNDNLAHLGAIDKKLAEEFHTGFADVHGEMIEAMRKAKGDLGDKYDVCGTDGVHPHANGHLLMAAAYLKALGMDGNIGEITIDMKGASSASDGHKATGENGKAEIESRKWPFCFSGDDNNPDGTRSILKYCNFNEDLNRLTLKVKNLEAPKARVQWGDASVEFTREQLTAGVNLTSSFRKTPFDEKFQQFVGAIGIKQDYETFMIKSLVTNFRNFAVEVKEDPEFGAALETVKKKMLAKQEKLETGAKGMLVPVKHVIVVTPN